MPEFFSSDGSLYLQAPVIFVVIAVVLLVGYWLFRRLSGRGLVLTGQPGSRSRQPRLGIVDIYELDRQRQLILLRRDNVEHLLLVGGPNDVVVERNVQRGGTARLPSERVIRPEPSSDLEDAGTGQSAAGLPAEPSFELPVTVPPPLPGSTTRREPRAPPLDPALFEPQAERAAPSESPPTGMSEARSRASRFLRRTLPPLTNTAEDAPAAETTHSPAEPSASPPPIMQAPEPRSVDPVVLSDMARQLEVALRRPSSAVTPPPGQTPRPVPPPQPPNQSEAPKLATPKAPEPKVSEPTLPDPKPAGTKQAEPKPAEPKTVADPIAAAMAAIATPKASSAPATQPKAAQAKPEPQPSAPPESTPAKPERAVAESGPAARGEPGGNPFSVEEIEAEFARLLGRPLDKSS